MQNGPCQLIGVCHARIQQGTAIGIDIKRTIGQHGHGKTEFAQGGYKIFTAALEFGLVARQHGQARARLDEDFADLIEAARGFFDGQDVLAVSEE